MTEIYGYYLNAIDMLMAQHESNTRDVKKYLESIAYQLDEKFPGEREFVRSEIVRANQIALRYKDPIKVLQSLDNAVYNYHRVNKRRKRFNLFRRILRSTSKNPRTLEQFTEELDKLVGGKRK